MTLLCGQQKWCLFNGYIEINVFGRSFPQSCQSFTGRFLPRVLEERSLNHSAEKFCFCQDIAHGEMVLCENEACTIGWFHFSYGGLQLPPVGLWYCSK